MYSEKEDLEGEERGVRIPTALQWRGLSTAGCDRDSSSAEVSSSLRGRYLKSVVFRVRVVK